MVKKIFIIISIVIGVVILVSFIFFFYTVNHKGKGAEQEFIVRQGQSTQEIAENLKKQNLIFSANFFILYTKIKGKFIQIGVYKLSPEQNMKEILDVLISGKASEHFATIPEGWRLTQIDEYLAEKNIIKQGELIKIASSDEGYLFPDTYRFLPQSQAEEVRKIMLENFQNKTDSLDINRDVVILASIVEREAKFDDDRAKIAGVYLNRLQQGMKLEADPTIQYAKGSWDPIKISDYKNVHSSYNTYLNAGLPPGPICNPGIKSIEAVLNQETNGYYYFFHKDDGHAVYSTTAEEHEENLLKYR